MRLDKQIRLLLASNEWYSGLAAVTFHSVTLTPKRIIILRYLKLFLEHQLANSIIKSKLEDML